MKNDDKTIPFTPAESDRLQLRRQDPYATSIQDYETETTVEDPRAVNTGVILLVVVVLVVTALLLMVIGDGIPAAITTVSWNG
jgi:hypothetical protein